MRRRRLTEKEQRRIALDKARYPAMTIEQLAEKHGVSKKQAWYAIHKFIGVALTSRNPKKRAQIAEEVAEKDDISLLEHHYRKLLAELDLAHFPIERRVSLLNTLANIRRKIAQLKLSDRLRSVDADFLLRVIRFYEPEATEERALQIIEHLRRK